MTDQEKWIRKEIKDLQVWVTSFAERANSFQQEADEIKDYDKAAYDSQIYWRNHYQEKECSVRRQLFTKQIELRKYLAKR